MKKAEADALRRYLRNHYEAIALGMNVGQIARDKAHRISIQLIRAGEELR